MEASFGAAATAKENRERHKLVISAVYVYVSLPGNDDVHRYYRYYNTLHICMYVLYVYGHHHGLCSYGGFDLLVDRAKLS